MTTMTTGLAVAGSDENRGQGAGARDSMGNVRRSSIAMRCAVACIALGLACGDDDGADDAGPSDAGVDVGEDVFVPGDAGVTVTYALRVRDLLTNDPVVTARVCVHNVPEIECVGVDEDGMAQIQVPVNAEVQLRTTAIRYFPLLNTLTTTDADGSADIDIGKRSNIAPLLAAVGIDLDETKGQLAFLAQTSPGSGLEGVSVTVTPESGEGPFYTRDSLPEDGLTATTSDGLGVYANLDPGRIEVVYDNPNGGCAPGEGWPSSTANALTTNIEAEHLTIVIAYCDGPGDAGIDAGVDAGADAAVDAGLDGAVEAGLDAGVDGG